MKPYILSRYTGSQPLLTVSINDCVYLFFSRLSHKCSLHSKRTKALMRPTVASSIHAVLQNANHVSKICLVRLVRIRSSFRPSAISHCLLVPSTWTASELVENCRCPSSVYTGRGRLTNMMALRRQTAVLICRASLEHIQHRWWPWLFVGYDKPDLSALLRAHQHASVFTAHALFLPR